MARCEPAPTCVAALAQATVLWPSRSRASDGICPSAAHTAQNPTSDHELGNAFDLTHDPTHGCDNNRNSELLRVRVDRRVKYVIWNRRIWTPGISPLWRPYNGDNPHTSHMHVSIYDTYRGDVSPWWEEAHMAPDNPSLPNLPDIKFFVVLSDANGVCTGYYFVSSDGQLHSYGPGAIYHGRSEVVT